MIRVAYLLTYLQHTFELGKAAKKMSSAFSKDNERERKKERERETGKQYFLSTCKFRQLSEIGLNKYGFVSKT